MLENVLSDLNNQHFLAHAFELYELNPSGYLASAHDVMRTLPQKIREALTQLLKGMVPGASADQVAECENGAAIAVLLLQSRGGETARWFNRVLASMTANQGNIVGNMTLAPGQIPVWQLVAQEAVLLRELLNKMALPEHRGIFIRGAYRSFEAFASFPSS